MAGSWYLVAKNNTVVANLMNTKQRFWDLVADIPLGKVTTYKRLAITSGLNNPRLVGKWLHNNNDTVKYPCHRVIKSDGTIASGYAFGGAGVQQQLLENEGVIFINGKADLTKYLYRF